MGAQWTHAGRQASATAKGQVFSKAAKEIMLAARGGADPNMNARLRAAVESAKKHSMPRETLERAIKKGAGLLDEQVTYETVTYEGFAPHRVPVIIECLTDSATTVWLAPGAGLVPGAPRCAISTTRSTRHGASTFRSYCGAGEIVLPDSCVVPTSLIAPAAPPPPPPP